MCQRVVSNCASIHKENDACSVAARERRLRRESPNIDLHHSAPLVILAYDFYHSLERQKPEDLRCDIRQITTAGGAKLFATILS